MGSTLSSMVTISVLASSKGVLKFLTLSLELINTTKYEMINSRTIHINDFLYSYKLYCLEVVFASHLDARQRRDLAVQPTALYLIIG